MEDIIIFITYISSEGSVIYENLVERNGIVYLKNNIATTHSSTHIVTCT